MDNEEEFLNTFFTLVSQLSYEKAKENVVRGTIFRLGFLVVNVLEYF